MNTLRHRHPISTLTLIALCVVTIIACSNYSVADNGKAEIPTAMPAHNHSTANNGTANIEPSNDPAESSSNSEIDLATLTMTVYKSPTCGCCSGWVKYMEEEGFKVESIDTDDMNSVKVRLGLTSPKLHSCHTAVIDGYVIEGHVPSNDVKRLLSEKPEILALTAPGMPMMSPGMASRTPKDYNVLSVGKEGQIDLWSAY